MRRRSNRSERGATLIEAAITAPVFLLLIFGIMEAGFLMRNYLVVTSSTTEAVRMATVRGAARDADYNALVTLAHGLGTMDRDDIEVIVIYKADGASDAVPPQCLTASVDGLCNRYTTADLYNPYRDASDDRTEWWGCVENVSADRFWCPESRETYFDGPPDYVGIYTEATHTYLTGFIGSTRTLTADRVLRIEPNLAD